MDLKTDRMRGVIVRTISRKFWTPPAALSVAVLQQYRDTLVREPACRESLADLLDYNYIRSKVLTGDIVKHTYKKTDGTTFRINVTRPTPRADSHIDETLWISFDFCLRMPGSSILPPQTKNKQQLKKKQSTQIRSFLEF